MVYHVTKGASGDLVCTGILNADMPLIRYSTGDRGALRAESDCLPMWSDLTIFQNNRWQSRRCSSYDGWQENWKT